MIFPKIAFLLQVIHLPEIPKCVMLIRGYYNEVTTYLVLDCDIEYWKLNTFHQGSTSEAALWSHHGSQRAHPQQLSLQQVVRGGLKETLLIINFQDHCILSLPYFDQSAPFFQAIHLPEIPKCVMWLKEGRKRWVKHYFSLRVSGLYYTAKGVVLP